MVHYLIKSPYSARFCALRVLVQPDEVISYEGKYTPLNMGMSEYSAYQIFQSPSIGIADIHISQTYGEAIEKS